MKYFSLFILIFTLHSCLETSTDSGGLFENLQYKIYFGDRLAGSQGSWLDSLDNYRFTYEFNDRGRGPKYDETIKLNKAGFIVFQNIIGHNYLKDTVNEEFIADGNKASWNSSSENGSAPFDGKKYFSSIDGSYGSSELLIRLLLKDPKKSLSLLPSGEVRLLENVWHTIGDSLELKLISISGFSFTPSYYWFDQNDRLFAMVSSWFSCIQDGYEDLKEQLNDIQEKAVDEYFEKIAGELTIKRENGIAIENVSLFDARAGKVFEGQTILIEGNTITNVGNTDEIEIPDAAFKIDGSGKTAMAGLFDMHTHIRKSDGLLHIAAGVSSVRDMANSLDLPDLKEQFNSNQLVGPRILVMSGFIDQAGPFAGPTGKIVSSLEEGLEAIEFYKSRGYHQIKLYSSIDPDWVEPLCTKAHQLNMRISGHIPAFMVASQAVEDGYDEIQHVNMLLLNFLPDTIDTRTPLRFSMVAEYSHELDLQSADVLNFAELLKRNHIVLDPTVSIFEGMFTTKAGEPDPALSLVLDRLPIQIKRNYFSGGLPIPEGKEGQYKKSYQKMLDVVRFMHDNGVTVVPGTDMMAGFGLHKELENYVRAGIPPTEVLQMATLTCASVAGVEEKLGTIEPGKLADVILIDGNPAENISDIRKVALTIKDGNLYYPEKIYEAIGVRPW